MSNIESPIPLADIEAVLSWVDKFTLSRPTKKISRDFSDAVLLAEILNVHYPKLVEMHNYPPRNSHALKLNNWMTLNRKVLKKLKVNLCCKTMDQLANCTPGVIERVLITVHDKIRRDEELNKSMKDSEQNVSSGGSYYEACGDDDQILVVPMKTRVNGVLETIHQKVVSYDTYLAMKEELKDAKDTTDVLKQKVDHLDSLLKLREVRIDELQKQLDRKATRRKEVEVFQNSLNVPFDNVVSPSTPKLEDIIVPTKTLSAHKLDETMPLVRADEIKILPKLPIELASKIPVAKPVEDPLKIAPKSDGGCVESKISQKLEDISKIPITKTDLLKPPVEMPKAIEEMFRKASNEELHTSFTKLDEIMKRSSEGLLKPSTKIEIPQLVTPKASHTILSAVNANEAAKEIHKVKSEDFQDTEDFKDSVQETILTIEDSIKEEIMTIHNETKPDFINRGPPEVNPI